VLIPRPETEILVDAALEGVDSAIVRGELFNDAEEHALAREAAEKPAPQEETDATLDAESDDSEPEVTREPLPVGPRVLEVGCGTGCIALSIASERPGTNVWATDLSEQAVRLSIRNRDALRLGDFVHIRECDLASAVPEDLMGTFSVLVSNPPYIPSAVVPTLPYEVQGFEPGLALDGGADGLDVFRRLLELAPRVLAPSGMLCVELFEENVHAARDLVLAQGGWDTAEVREDLTHRPRVLVAIREGA
jgi:release factor glutamine methyltransferase